MSLRQFEDFGAFDYGDYGADIASFDFGAIDTGFDLGLDPWTETLAVDTGNIGLDTPISLDAGALPEFSFPDLDLSAFLKYGAQAFTLYQQYEAIQSAKERGVAVPMPGATTTTTTTRPPATRTVTDPATGQLVQQVYDPRTGSYVTQAARPEWIPGVPNWALLAGGAVAAFLLLGGIGKR